MRSFGVPFSVGVLSAGVGIGGLVWYWLHRRRFTQKSLPCGNNNWQHVGSLNIIDIFPMRSGAPIHLTEVECTNEALKYRGILDRQFVLLQPNGKAIYAGKYPVLLSVTTQIVDENLVKFSSPTAGEIEVNLKQLRNLGKFIIKPKKGFSFKLIEGTPEHHQWFSNLILKKDEGLRLFFKEEPLIRKHFWTWQKPDHFPIMMMSNKSVDDLNQRLSAENQVHAQQFRPNFLVETLDEVKPYDEEHWLWVRIGNDLHSAVILKYNSFCYRCILPNIDVESFQRNPQCEPLKTLKKYKIRDNPKEPVMGSYFDVIRTGLVRKGDPVYVLYQEK